MSKQDFVLISAVLRHVKPTDQQTGYCHSQWEATVRAFAEMLERNNVRFSVELFLKACEYP